MGEIFAGLVRDNDEEVPIDPDPVLWRAETQFVSPIFVFETKYQSQEHLGIRGLNMSLSDYLTYLESRRYNRFILIHRRNILRKLVSFAQGRQRGYWHVRGIEAPHEKVIIDVEAVEDGHLVAPLLDLLEYYEALHCVALDALSSRRHLSLFFEDDIETDVFVGAQKVSDFLGTTQNFARPSLRKTNTRSMMASIENYSEVRDQLLGTRFEWMLSG
jgi:hypothetical protein